MSSNHRVGYVVSHAPALLFCQLPWHIRLLRQCWYLATPFVAWNYYMRDNQRLGQPWRRAWLFAKHDVRVLVRKGPLRVAHRLVPTADDENWDDPT